MFYEKSISHDVYYSQLEPGLFTKEERQDITKLEEAKLSIGAINTMLNFESLLNKYKPLNSRAVENGGELILKTTIIAHDKKGPAYSDHQMAQSSAKNLLTLGLAGSDYDIVVDFQVQYELMSQNTSVHSKTFEIQERLDHTSSDFEFKRYKNLDDASKALFEKHISATISEFYQEAANKLN